MDIANEFAQTGSQRMFSRTLVAGLNRLEARPWRGLRNGKGINDVWLADQLAPYGIQPRTLRIDDKTCRGYEGQDLKEVFQRYAPRPEMEALLAARAAGA